MLSLDQETIFKPDSANFRQLRLHGILLWVSVDLFSARAKGRAAGEHRSGHQLEDWHLGTKACVLGKSSVLCSC